MNQLVLASSSPRRKEILEQVGYSFRLRKQNTDESEVPTLTPEEMVKELAVLKGRNTPFQQENEVILAADTVVAYQGRVFGKPTSEEDAYNMLKSLSGEIHEVYTGVMLRLKEKELVFAERTLVQFWELTDDDIWNYIRTKEPFDKAGAYGIQGPGAVLVQQIEGDYYNVVGLPISRTVRALKEFSIYPVS